MKKITSMWLRAKREIERRKKEGTNESLYEWNGHLLGT
jgi:hypothetical protein